MGIFHQKYLDSWNNLEDKIEFNMVTIEIAYSGTFIRKICEDFGKYIELPCMAFYIERLAIHLVQ